MTINSMQRGLSSLGRGTCDVLFSPYMKGNRQINKSIYGVGYPLSSRAVLFIRGSICCIPVLNNVGYILYKAFSCLGSMLAEREPAESGRSMRLERRFPDNEVAPSLTIFKDSEIVNVHRQYSLSSGMARVFEVETSPSTIRALTCTPAIKRETYGKHNLTSSTFLACVEMVIKDCDRSRGSSIAAPAKEERTPPAYFVDAGFRMASSRGLKEKLSSIEVDRLCFRRSDEELGRMRLYNLQQAIAEKGPALVCLAQGTEFFYVVVDYVSPGLDLVRLRDPYHGWDVTVQADAFCKRLPYYLPDIIQFTPKES